LTLMGLFSAVALWRLVTSKAGEDGLAREESAGSLPVEARPATSGGRLDSTASAIHRDHCDPGAHRGSAFRRDPGAGIPARAGTRPRSSSPGVIRRAPRTLPNTFTGVPSILPGTLPQVTNLMLLEKVGLISVVTIIFGRIIPGVQAQSLQIAFCVALALTINAYLVDRLARQWLLRTPMGRERTRHAGTRRRFPVWLAFPGRCLLNFGIVLLFE
ncbi:MAG: hypothetical protein H5T84_10340, partial [Thermoleophilia bacterium]|nr:hypothetical protein [Thermoleophilia bacterium]